METFLEPFQSLLHIVRIGLWKLVDLQLLLDLRQPELLIRRLLLLFVQLVYDALVLLRRLHVVWLQSRSNQQLLWGLKNVFFRQISQQPAVRQLLHLRVIRYHSVYFICVHVRLGPYRMIP